MSTPNDHQSALCVCPLLLTTSGAMYSIVPQKEYALLSWSMASLLNPKSEERDRRLTEKDGQKDREKKHFDAPTCYFYVPFFVQENTVGKCKQYVGFKKPSSEVTVNKSGTMWD